MQVYVPFREPPLEDNVAGRRLRLSYSDMPAGVYIRSDGSRVSLEFEYLGGEEEPHEPVDEGYVTAQIGRFSKRLMRLELDVERAIQEGQGRRDPAAAATTCARTLASTLHDLQERARRAGPRLNYRAAVQGLGLPAEESAQDTPAPPWLIEALGALRTQPGASQHMS